MKLILEEAGGIQPLEIDKDELTIGRTADNAVRVQDALSSRKHCKIEKTKDGFVVEDLKSRNGTTLNGEPLVERRLLAIGDRISIGQSTIHFGAKLEGAPAKKPAPATANLAPAGSARTKRFRFALKGVEGDRTGKQWGISAFPYTIGRKKNLSLTLDEEEVSAEHCMLVEDEGTVHVVDLNSATGTFVDGSRVKGRARVKPNAILAIGKTKLKFKDLAGKGADFASDDETGPPAGAPAEAKKPAAAAPPAKKAVAVAEEVTDLDGLGDDEPDPAKTPAANAEFDPAATPMTGVKRQPKAAPKQPADAPGAARGATSRRKPGVQTPESPVAAAAPGFEEAGIAASDFSSKKIDQGEERGAFGAIAIVLVVIALLGAGSAVAIAALAPEDPDPAPTGNRVDNWSFEDGARGWTGTFKIVADTNYGKRAARLDGSGEGKQELRQAEALRLERDNPKGFSVHASIKTEGSASGVLAIEWADDQNKWTQLFYAAVAEHQGTWADVGAVGIPPPNATLARVVVQAIGGGTLFVDRVTLQEVDLPKEAPPKLSGAGFDLVASPRGVLSITRADRQVARVMVGLAGPQGERAAALALQDAMVPTTPAGDPGDGGIYADGTLLDVGSGERVECAMSAKLQSEALRVTWEVPKKQLLPEGRKLRIVFAIPRLAELSPVKLVCESSNKMLDELLAKGGAASLDGVREITFGKEGADQTSLSIQRPVTVEVEKVQDGVRLELSGVPEVRGTSSDVGVLGFDLKKGSRLANEQVRTRLDQADKAMKDGRFEDARRMYAQIAKDFDFNPDVKGRADKLATFLGQKADRLLEATLNAAQDAEELSNPALVDAARHWAEVLEKAFPGNPNAQRAKDAASRAEQAVKKVSLVSQEKTAKELVNRGKTQRKDHPRLARTTYKYVIDVYPDSQAAVEAKRLLESMPKEDD
ncbi:FHA domain-containing protein [bacterium]|nr:FHA domain-containing protein [bacterium]